MSVFSPDFLSQTFNDTDFGTSRLEDLLSRKSLDHEYFSYRQQHERSSLTRCCPSRPIPAHIQARGVYDAIVPIVSPSANLILSVDWIDHSPIFLGFRTFDDHKPGCFVLPKDINWGKEGNVRNIGDTILAINGRDVSKLNLSDVMIMLSRCGEFAKLRLCENPSLTVAHQSADIAMQRTRTLEKIIQNLHSDPDECKALLRIFLASLKYESSMKHARDALQLGLLPHPYLLPDFSSFLPKHVDFSFAVSLTPHEISALANALQTSSHVTRLKLSCQPVRKEQVTHLGKMLKSNRSLKMLDLSWNRLGDEGATVLADALQNGCNNTLESLALRVNGIGLEGMASIAKMLKNNSVLKDLNLAFNGITDEVAIMLAEALRHNSSLLKINICDIRVGTDGILAFLKCVKDDSSLDSLSISNHTLVQVDITSDESGGPNQSTSRTGRLNQILSTNSTLGPSKARRSKIMKYLETNFRSTFLSPTLDSQMFPRAFEWVASSGHSGSLSIAFDLVRNFPEIFSLDRGNPYTSSGCPPFKKARLDY